MNPDGAEERTAHALGFPFEQKRHFGRAQPFHPHGEVAGLGAKAGSGSDGVTV